MSVAGATVTAIAGFGTDLIVDFVERRRSRTSTAIEAYSEVEDKDTTTATMSKQVRFSEDVHIHSFPHLSKQEISRRWDSKRDKFLFKQELARDVWNIRHLLSTTPMEELEKEVLYRCLGLEALVSSQVTRYLKRMREEHSSSIVELQYRLSGEQLAAYSMSRSLQSRERAQNLALANWEILP